ncbi:MAG: peptide chain release factor N(5)-glutamine methyltransferase, partial [Pseudomarimonas sp.]
TLDGEDGAREVDWLIAHALGQSQAWLFAHADFEPTAAVTADIERLIEARASGVPVAQLTGRRGFWTLDLSVDSHTLIPRPETELLVELALARLPVDAKRSLVDLGTGSGAIALAVASERPLAHVIATDASAGALRMARSNAIRLDIGNVEFRLGNWCTALNANEQVAMIVSNPPYLGEDDPHLSQGDLCFEPRSALVSGADGLDAIRQIAAEAMRHLLPGGWLLLEHGQNQGIAVRDVLVVAGWRDVHTERDLEARERVSLGRNP